MGEAQNDLYLITRTKFRNLIENKKEENEAKQSTEANNDKLRTKCWNLKNTQWKEKKLLKN